MQLFHSILRYFLGEKVPRADSVRPGHRLQVVLSRHESGLTLDFPLPDDFRPRTRRHAWRIFEVGILLAIGSIAWFGLCSIMDWRDLAYISIFALGAGLIVLVEAAAVGSAAWSDMDHDDDLRQISVAGNMLIRTTRDHRKQVWYRQEIRAIVIDDPAETRRRVSVELLDGERALLIAERDEREMEWIATVLRQSLLAETNHESTPAADPRTGITPAIKDGISPDVPS